MDKKSKYTFYGSSTLTELREDHQFCERHSDVDGTPLYFPVEVGEVRVIYERPKEGEDINKPPYLHMAVQCDGEVSGVYTLDYPISKKDFLSFVDEKSDDQGRMSLLLKYSKGDLHIRKIEGTRFTLRLDRKLMKQLDQDADACKMSTSAYVRKLLHGKRPRKAVTGEELEIMQDFVLVYRQYVNFWNAVQGTLKGMTPEQKLKYMIEGTAYKSWREFLIKGLPVMKRLIDGSRMRENLAWLPADGKKLPKFDREVIALAAHGNELKVVYAHRPNPRGWDGKNIDTGVVEHHIPKLYDIGKWNQPDIRYWLDVELPKPEEE